MDLTRSANQAIQVSGASSTEAAAGVTLFAQAIASGGLSGDKLGSILEDLPRLAKALADGLGVTVSELGKMGDAGELSADRIAKALLSQKETLQKEYEQLPVMVGRAVAQTQNEFLALIAAVDEAAGASDFFASIATGSAEYVRDIRLRTLGGADAEMRGYLKAQIDVIQQQLKDLDDPRNNSRDSIKKGLRSTYEARLRAKQDRLLPFDNTINEAAASARGTFVQGVDDAVNFGQSGPSPEALEARAQRAISTNLLYKNILDIRRETANEEARINEKAQQQHDTIRATVNTEIRRTDELRAQLEGRSEAHKKVVAINDVLREIRKLEERGTEKAKDLAKDAKDYLEILKGELDAQEKLNNALDEQKAIEKVSTSVEAMNFEIKILDAEIAGRKELAKWLKFEKALKDQIDRKLTPDELKQLREVFDTKFDREQQLQEQQSTANDMTKIWDRAGESVQQTLAGTFRDALDGNLDSAKDFGDAFLNIMKDVAAQSAAAFVFGDWFEDALSGVPSSTAIDQSSTATTGEAASEKAAKKSVAAGGGPSGVGQAALIGGAATFASYSADQPKVQTALTAGGAVVGGVIGSFYGATAQGAAIGGTLGNLVGGLIGGDGPANTSRSSAYLDFSRRNFPTIDKLNRRRNFDQRHGFEFGLTAIDEMVRAADLLGATIGDYAGKVSVGYSQREGRTPKFEVSYRSFDDPAQGGGDRILKNFSNRESALAYLIDKAIETNLLEGISDYDKEKLEALGTQAGLQFIESRKALTDQFADTIAGKVPNLFMDLQEDLAKELKALERAADTYEITQDEFHEFAKAGWQVVNDGLTDAARDLAGVARDTFGGLRDPLEDFQRQIQVDSGTLSPGEQFAEARTDFRGLAKRAGRGEVEAIQDLVGSGQTFMRLAQENFASGAQFGDVFKEVNRALSGVIGTIDQSEDLVIGDIASLHLDATKNQTETLKSLQEAQIEEIKKLREAVDNMSAERPTDARYEEERRDEERRREVLEEERAQQAEEAAQRAEEQRAELIRLEKRILSQIGP